MRLILLAILLAIAAIGAKQALAAPLPQACANDAKRLCASQPAGPRLDQCMKQNEKALSNACRTALRPAQAAPQAAAQAAAPCQADFEKLCKGVQPGEGRVQACFKQNESKLSKACKASLAKLQQQAQGQGDACKADVDRLCKGVQPGEGRIVACIQKQQSKLSNGCKAQIAALQQRQQQQQQDPGPCAGDAARFCPDVQAGQGRMLACLKEHTQQLMPTCRQAIAGR